MPTGLLLVPHYCEKLHVIWACAILIAPKIRGMLQCYHVIMSKHHRKDYNMHGCMCAVACTCCHHSNYMLAW